MGRRHSPHIRLSAVWLATAAATGAGLPTAHAEEVAVELDCTIAVTSGFDCVQLRRLFFQDKPLPFVKESRGQTPSALKISVGRVSARNGYTYETTLTQGPTTRKREIFLSDGVNPVAAQELISEAIQAEVLALVPQKNGHQAPTQPQQKDGGLWIFQPGINLNFGKGDQNPGTINASANAKFNHSAPRDRFQASVDGSFNRQSVAVTTGGNLQLVGVNTHALGGNATYVHALDPGSHVNMALNAGASTNPVANVNASVGTSWGVELNLHPFLKTDSKTFAVGCNVGPVYYSFVSPNVLDRKQFLALSQGCAVIAAYLLDKTRGTVISGSLGQSWIINAPEIVKGTATVGATIRATDRLSIIPQFYVSLQTKSVTAISQKVNFSTDGLTPQELAEQQTRFAAQSSAASTFSYGGGIGISYTFGDGGNRASQDQRGGAAR